MEAISISRLNMNDNCGQYSLLLKDNVTVIDKSAMVDPLSTKAGFV
jgi:hypothetical protein